MQVAFYKGKDHFFDRLVQWWTKGPYSHVELVINGVCYTSSPRDNGVRMKLINLHSGNWDVFDLMGDEDYALAWFKEHMGQKYDYLGLLGFVLPFRRSHPSMWFCSEAVGQAALKDPKSYLYHPNGLLKVMRDLNLVTPAL